MTQTAVLEIIDSAESFIDVHPLVGEDLRRAGLAALNVELAALRAAGALSIEERQKALQQAALAIGGIISAEAIVEAFAKAALEDAAAGAGLIRDLGARDIKKAISAALKEGKKIPRAFTGPAAAATDTLQSQPRPGEAGNSAADRTSSSSDNAKDTETIASSSLSDVSSDPPALSEGGNREKPPTLANDREQAMKECAELDHSDTDNGKRLIRYFGDDLLVRRESGTPTGTWLGWTGTHWDIDNGPALAAILAQQVGDIIMEEAWFIDPTKAERTAIETAKAARVALKEITEPEERPLEVMELERQIKEGEGSRAAVSKRRAARRKHGLATKNRAKMTAMLDCAGPHIRRSPDDFNSDPMLVATLTHTLKFHLAPDPECPDPDVTRIKWNCEATADHRREDLLTGVVPVKFDANAECPRWRANMERFQPNEAQRRTVQQFAGLGLLGKPIQRVMFHYGTGGNFKSVFLETITRVLGDSFAIGLPTESLIGGAEGSAGGARPDLERVFGKRMLRILELPAGVSLKADLIKKLTGGEKWPVRTLYKGFFEFIPLAKPHMSGNDYPQFDGSDGGMRRRLLVIEWPVKIAEDDQRDFDVVVGELMEEAPGILNWLIEGAIDYLQNGLFVSEETRANTQDYFDEMDPTAMFIRDCVREAPGQSVGARSMYQAYKSHCEANARRPIFETKFGRIMKKKIKRDDKRTHKYLDVELHDVPSRPDPVPPDSSQPPDDRWEKVNDYGDQ